MQPRKPRWSQGNAKQFASPLQGRKFVTHIGYLNFSHMLHVIS